LLGPQTSQDFSETAPIDVESIIRGGIDGVPPLKATNQVLAWLSAGTSAAVVALGAYRVMMLLWF
jgi:hypothetical protein